jgi:hypothetical protein
MQVVTPRGFPRGRRRPGTREGIEFVEVTINIP